MSLSWYKSLVKESFEFLDSTVDAARREVLADAVEQADTLEELGLLTLLPGLRWAADTAPDTRPTSQMVALLGETAALVVVVTRLDVVHPEVLARHGLTVRDGTLYSLMGGVGEGHQWHSLPHGLGRCRANDHSLVWLDDMSQVKERQFGLLHAFEWQRGAAAASTTGAGGGRNLKPETLHLRFRTYQGERLEVHAQISARGVGRLRLARSGEEARRRPRRTPRTSALRAVPGRLLSYHDCQVRDYWVHDVKTNSEWWHRWPSLHPVALDQWVKVRVSFRGAADDWQVWKAAVKGPLPEDSRVKAEKTTGHEPQSSSSSSSSSDWQLRVLDTAAPISDTSGRAMFYPVAYELSGSGGETWHVRSDYAEAVAYLPNGSMNWLGPGRVFDVHGQEVGVCLLEAHQFQSVDEVIGTTLQLAGFVDRRDDDTRNDWELFRP